MKEPSGFAQWWEMNLELLTAYGYTDAELDAKRVFALDAFQAGRLTLSDLRAQINVRMDLIKQFRAQPPHKGGQA